MIPYDTGVILVTGMFAMVGVALIINFKYKQRMKNAKSNETKEI